MELIIWLLVGHSLRDSLDGKSFHEKYIFGNPNGNFLHEDHLYGHPFDGNLPNWDFVSGNCLHENHF